MHIQTHIYAHMDVYTHRPAKLSTTNTITTKGMILNFKYFLLKFTQEKQRYVSLVYNKILLIIKHNNNVVIIAVTTRY